MVSSHQLLKKAFCRGNITSRAEHELDCASHGIDGSVKIFPLRADLHVRLVEAVGGAAHLQVRAHPLVDLWSVTLHPAEDGRLVYGESPLPHHLLQVAVRELVPAIPPDAQKDDRGLEKTPLERGLVLLQGYDSRRVMDEPEDYHCLQIISATEPVVVRQRLRLVRATILI